MKYTLTTSILTAATALFLCNCKGGSSNGAAAEAATGGGGTSAGATGGTPITLDCPPELIEGTPKPMSVPNLVQVPNEPRKLLVPADATLLSKGKKVTGSDANPIIGTLDLITDGDKQAGEGYFVELLDGLQWVQIDLEKTADISAVCVWHFHSQRRAYNDVIIQVSDDAEFKTGVTTIYNNDFDKSAEKSTGPICLGKNGLGTVGLGKDNPYVESRFGLVCDGMGSKGRYVRLYSNGNTSNEMNHYIEVEVYGVAK